MNDSLEEAGELVEFARGIFEAVPDCKLIVNLIPYNPTGHSRFQTPDPEQSSVVGVSILPDGFSQRPSLLTTWVDCYSGEESLIQLDSAIGVVVRLCFFALSWQAERASRKLAVCRHIPVLPKRLPLSFKVTEQLSIAQTAAISGLVDDRTYDLVGADKNRFSLKPN